MLYVKTEWPALRERLPRGRYRPALVRTVLIPKRDGGERELGSPTLTDSLIQQALLQVLQSLLDPTFSEHSYGFHPERRAHDAVLAAQGLAQSGRRIVVDVDLEKFFDRVDHDILMGRLRRRIKDTAALRQVRAYLDSGHCCARAAGGETAACCSMPCLIRPTSTPWGCPGCPDLKLANRPVRTRTPGGVAGARLS